MARRRLFGLIALNVAGLSIAASLAGLGTWQMQRRTWKLDLIARVEARVHADPVAAPAPADWPGISAARDEYRRVRVVGSFLPHRTAFVQAVTVLGAGFWAMTPLRARDGFVVMINRGFVPADGRESVDSSLPAGSATVTGLLRLTEPGGGFLRNNDPGADRWYSRDIAAIGAEQGFTDLAPYFIDAESTPGEGFPRGGLTVVAFSNNHLVYAVTWYVLALMVLGAIVHLDRDAWRRSRPS